MQNVISLGHLNGCLHFSLYRGFLIILTVLFEGWIFYQNLCLSNLRLGDQQVYGHVHVQVFNILVIVIGHRKKSIFVIGPDN